MKLTLDTPVVDLFRHGVAKLTPVMSRKLAVALAPLSAKTDPEEVTVEDLLNYFPTRYEDRSHFMSLDQLADGMEAAVELYVRGSGGMQVGRNRDPRRPPLYLFEITGGDAERRLRPVSVKWFVSGKNSRDIIDWYTKRFTRGVRFVAYGRWEYEKRGTFALKIAKPDEIEILPADKDAESFGLLENDSAPSVEHRQPKEDEEDYADPALATVHTGRVPIYRKLGPFQTKRLREIVHSALDELDAFSVHDEIPAEVLRSQQLISRHQALKEIHFPPPDASINEYEMYRSPAQRRLIFEEFFWLAFAMQLLRGEREKEPKGTVIEINDHTRERLKALLPFKLTDAQKKVVGEIFDDLKSDAPMNRLIQGDVGSGKTIVAFLAMFAAMENGYQTALMAPTEILAEQHARNAETILGPSGYRIALLVGSRQSAAKKKLHADIAAGEVDMVIGTNAIIQDAVKFDRLGLAVIDEQHRFGVLQRAQLKASGQNPDILVMTATPIPRSLAMTVYGDLDVSVIDELPPGRTPVKTVVVGEDQRKGVYKGIEREIKLGRQAYVVYPLIEESAKTDLKAATIMYDDLRKRVFPHLRVGLLHGKMKAAEKEEIMAEFVAGGINILVSTTVIEVGVDVPNASLMIVEHAERFGLSQLHQLRGRVGRGADQSYCVLLTGDKKTAVAKERLGIMEETSDGFKIAEKDLQIRGEGEILGTRQSGLQNFKIGNLVRDLDILVSARKSAEEYLIEHRNSPETNKLIKRVRSHRAHRLGGVG
ncbi:MAG: ATP-dependent DNA helicase RecG [Acidobacteria bacterium]|nr:ATP-dependent DNA helicase RecG [Acidobacteriota bacterium]